VTAAGAQTAAPWRWQLLRQPVPGLDLQRDHCVDALLVWDLLTQFARHGGPARGSHWRVLLEFAIAPAAAGLDDWCALPSAEGHQATLRHALAPSLARAAASPVHTALLPEALLPLLLAAVSGGVLLRFTLGAPCSPAPAEATPGRAASWPCTPEPGLVNTLGLVDHGCCLAHADFRDADGRSRIAALWDQETATLADAPWARHAGTGGAAPYRYGSELARPAIDALLARHPGLGERAERALYAALGRPQWGAPAHRQGAAMMHLLAGRRALPPGEADAARMPLLFAQLPAATVADPGGDALGFHVVDGARWIVDRSRALATDPNAWRCTIALGLGSLAGPHDGSSMAEQALDQLTADARVSVVVTAGHGADAQVHAQARVRQDQPAVWWLRLPADKHEDSVAQIWLPADQPPERFQLVLQGPGLPASPLLQLGQAATLAQGDGLPIVGVVRAMKAAQGLRGHLILLAWAPTARRRGASMRPLAPAGLWQLTLQAAGPQPAVVQAWLERDDRPFGPRRRPQQARFEPHGPPASRADPHPQLPPALTLGSLANGLRCTVAAGHELHSGRLSPASGRGPRRDTGPEAAPLCFAPINVGPSRPGLPVPGFFSGQRSRVAGTAAAAPQVARWLAEGRLTDPATRWLRPALHLPQAVPPEARCLPPPDCTDFSG